jgi:hypothetical protein
MNYFDAPEIRKPTMQVWRLPNGGGYWATFPPHAGVVADIKADAIARLKKEFPEITTWVEVDHTVEKPHQGAVTA